MYEALPFIHSVYAQSKQQFSTCEDHSSGLGVHPQIAQCVLTLFAWSSAALSARFVSFWFVNIFIFFAIFKTSLLEVSFFIHIGTPPTKLWILEQETFK
jgi:hypothetical protein